ncbi:hypothetical protein KAR91_53365 [Candidatus Pacearchaeota archaeon]|nr:hypothetical protein [Candidatus Pacearchaeota archaeon]
MIIISKANSVFEIDGIDILPGKKNYKKLDASKREVRYQLGILKGDGVIDFKELIPARPHRLPFIGKEQGEKEDAEDLKGEKAKAEKKKVKDAKPDARKPAKSNKKTGKD